jgi:plastocyanin
LPDSGIVHRGADQTYDPLVNFRVLALLVLLSALVAAPAALARSGLGDAVPAAQDPAQAVHSGPAVVARDAIAAPAATASRSGTAKVTIVDYAYDPDQLTVNPGETVLWTNEGTAKEGHTVTDKSGAFDSGILKNGDTYSHTFDAEGTFSLFCSVHPKMKQTVVVESRSAGDGGGGGGGGGNNGGGSGGGSGSGAPRSGGDSGSGGGASNTGGADGGGSSGSGGSGSSSAGSSSGGGSGNAAGGSGGGSLPMSGMDARLLALIGLDLLLAGAVIRVRLTS